jgi:hypothetical protein
MVDVQHRWKLTSDQIKHALRKNRAEAEYIVSRVSDQEGLKQFNEWQLGLFTSARLRKPRKGKK